MVFAVNGGELVALVGGSGGVDVVAANDLGSDQSSVVVGRSGGDTLGGNGNVGSGDGVVTETDLGTNKGGGVRGVDGAKAGGNGGARGLDVTEVLLGKSDKLLVLNSTGTGKDNAVALVELLDVVGELGLGDGLNVGSGAANGATETLALEGNGVEVVNDDLLVGLAGLVGALGDGCADALDGGLVNLGVLDNIGKDLDGL